MIRRYVLTRDVTTDECPWLVNVPQPITEGTVVYRFTKPTYGAVREFAATLDPEYDYPFFELPHDAVRPDPLEADFPRRYCKRCDYYTDHVSTAHDGLAERGLLRPPTRALPDPPNNQGAPS